jgi:hypothetical protein
MKTMFEGFRIAAGRAGEPAFLSVDEIRSYLKRGPMGTQANAQPIA